MPLKIERVAISSPESAHLLAELSVEIDRLYGNETPSRPHGAGMDDERAAFVIAREDKTAVGCGAIRPLSAQTAEVKRMYVRPGARRKGIARQIMHALEEIGREKGFSAIRLETGLRQPGAIRLYESLGYTRIAGFGDYKADPLSVCYGKSLI